MSEYLTDFHIEELLLESEKGNGDDNVARAMKVIVNLNRLIVVVVLSVVALSVVKVVVVE